MDYKEFYSDVADWILQVNQAAATYNMNSDAFWQWVTQSTGALGNKYGNTELVVKQLLMLIDWLEDVHKKMNEGEMK